MIPLHPSGDELQQRIGNRNGAQLFHLFLVAPQIGSGGGQIVIVDVVDSHAVAMLFCAGDDGIRAVLHITQGNTVAAPQMQEQSPELQADPAGYAPPVRSIYDAGPQDHQGKAELFLILHQDLLLVPFYEGIGIPFFRVFLERCFLGKDVAGRQIGDAVDGERAYMHHLHGGIVGCYRLQQVLGGHHGIEKHVCRCPAERGCEMIDPADSLYRPDGILGRVQRSEIVLDFRFRMTFTKAIESAPIAAFADEAADPFRPLCNEPLHQHGAQKSVRTGYQYTHECSPNPSICRNISSMTQPMRRMSRYGIGNGASSRMLS